MKENDVIWVSIEESDKYELSNYGFVRNKYTKKEKSFTYIKNNKYKAYCIDGIQYLAHRLVAKYFVINNNPEKYNIVNHIDENTYNNAYWNLEWCTNKENLLHSDVFNRISKKQSKYKVYQYDKDGNIIKIWDSKEQVYKAGFTSIKSALRQGFNRYFNGYFWFKEDEPFDKNRYAPTKQISVYNRNTNKLLFTGTIGECAKFLGVKPYIINNALRKDNMGVFKFIVINDKIK